MAVLYVRIPDALKQELDRRAELGKQTWPPVSLAELVRQVLKAGLDAIDAQEAKSPRKKVRRG